MAAPASLSVGFIGVGNMGWPMAANIHGRGHELTVHDLDRERSERFAHDHQCRAARSFADFSTVDFVVTMLPTGQIVRQVLLEDEGGLLQALRPGTIVIDMSSSDPVGTRQLGPILASRGVILIDAPVSGAVPRAKSGTLTIMIGGDDAAAIARARVVLECMGNRLFETGPLGSGHAMKALNNFMAAAGFVAAAEALSIGRRFGLDPAVMLDIINVSTGRNFTSEMVFKEHVVGGKHATGFSLGLLTKDVRIAAGLGEAVHFDAPLTRLISERWSLACDRLGAQRDHSEAVQTWDESFKPPST